MKARSVPADRALDVTVAVDNPTVAPTTDRYGTPTLTDHAPELQQIAVDLAVELAYGRGFADGRRVGWTAGNRVGFGVRQRINVDRTRRLDDARTGDYRGKSEQRDDRLMDNLRATGIITERAA